MSSGEMAEPHDVQWTAERVERFWNAMSGRAPEAYFSAMVAPALADFVKRRAAPRMGGLVVDVGCGNGDLLAEMQGRGYRVFGVDSSIESLRRAGSKIGEQNVGHGSVRRIPLPDDSAQGLLLIETIEHVLDDDITPMMDELSRVLEVGAPLVITTPNGEDLGAAKVTCPECAGRFHPMQHVRSWTAPSLTAFLRESGFERVETYETRLAEVDRRIPAAVQRLAFAVLHDRRHLIAVARTS
jgi:2-polyprenyl-6-hydroxyphenyl methylase/3-demethylubiquinone-9 3-methyltransferase